MSKILFDRPYVYGYGEKYVVTDGKKITYIGGVRPDGKFDRVISGKDRLMLPGLYNCHTHAAMTLFRGYGEGLPLSRWLNERIFPAEDRLSPARVLAASRLACAEMVRNGIVSFSDMYFFCTQTAQAVGEAGMKANISRAIVSFDPKADPEKDTRVIEAQKLYDSCSGSYDGRVKVDFSIHAEYTNVAPFCEYLAKYAQARGAVMHIHLSETEKEQAECIGRHGCTPAEFFDRCGLLDGPVLAAHCVWLTDSDIRLLASKGVSVAHNPVSNLKLGSGVMPLTKLLDAGINVTLGTDGAASNNTLDILKEMYIAAILHKGIERRADIISPDTVIRMATENGARAQGRENCGKLAAGYAADLILLDLDAINNIPVYDAACAAVLSANSSNVTLTMADGEVLYENGRFTKIDIERVKSDMRETCEHYFDD
jgi:5-methylthioadenosine/S-adenosylhomocysteine deaminase